jgi:hypothetical protein
MVRIYFTFDVGAKLSSNTASLAYSASQMKWLTNDI